MTETPYDRCKGCAEHPASETGYCDYCQSEIDEEHRAIYEEWEADRAFYEWCSAMEEMYRAEHPVDEQPGTTEIPW